MGSRAERNGTMAKLYPCALSGLVAMVGLAGSAGGGSLEQYHCLALRDADGKILDGSADPLDSVP
jgi:hypothetical protein